jgi:hypothetical protein
VPDQFAPLSGTAAGELAALKNLRAYLAGMQRLLGDFCVERPGRDQGVRALSVAISLNISGGYRRH